MSEGHWEARHYPVAMVWSEARIVRQRRAGRMKTEAALQEQVIAAVLSAKGHKQLTQTLKGLDEHD